MKHITFILTNDFNPDVRVYKEAKYLTDKGAKVTILCWNRDISRRFPKHEIKDGIEIIRFKIPSVYGTGMKQLRAFLRYIKACKHYLKNHNTDYLHCNDLDGVIAGYIASKKNEPYVFDMHEFYEKGSFLSRWIIRKTVKFFIKKSIASLCVHPAYYENNYSSIRSKLVMLRNYPDSTMIHYFEKTKSSFFRVAYHGVVRQYDEFIALFDAVKGMDDVRVDINGNGMTVSMLKERSKDYKNVYVNGPYDGITESSILYAGTDAIFCCYDSNDPNYQGDVEVVKFYEAICTGTPMIMTEGIGMSDKIEKNHFGVVCDTRNVISIKNAILKLKNDKKFWEESHKCELEASHNYKWETAVKVLDQVYSL